MASTDVKNMVDFVDLVDYKLNMPTTLERPKSAKMGSPASALRKLFRDFAEEVETYTSDPTLKPQVVKGELEKLAPTFEGLGFKIVISTTPRRIVKLVKRAQQPVAVTEARETASGFDPEKAGRRLVQQMQQAEGGAYSGAELNSLFALSPATLHRRRKEQRIIFWRDAKHVFHYPKWQFTATGALLEGIQEVLQIFKSTDEWRVMRYFLTSRHQLGDKSPLALLREGKADKVIHHAKLHEAENSW